MLKYIIILSLITVVAAADIWNIHCLNGNCPSGADYSITGTAEVPIISKQGKLCSLNIITREIICANDNDADNLIEKLCGDNFTTYYISTIGLASLALYFLCRK